METRIQFLHELITCELINAGVCEAGDGNAWDIATVICRKYRSNLKKKFKPTSHGKVCISK